MIIFKEFDWSQTQKDLLFVIPNWKRGKYIRKTIDNTINTSIPRDKWVILIINDGIHEDFSDLKDKNVLYFTLERKFLYERGDAFLRNIAIKYGQSKLFAQKDPEIFYKEDFIKRCFDHQDILYRCGGYAHLCQKENTELYFNNQININELERRAQKFSITDRFVYWHFGHSAQLEYFRKLNGYDEDFKTYGFTDTNMWDRLMKSGLKQFVDKNCSPIHLWHQKPDFNKNPKDKRDYEQMRNLYNNKQNDSIIVNIGVEWGEGDLNYRG
jgi:hypothetical protein